MTPAGSAARSSASAGAMSIGVVLAQLKQEFSDLTISKIRFWETEGLVTPQRTSSGYRQFFAPDMERLRYILTAQRDYYLPLRVIKQQLDDIDAGREPSVPGPPPPRSLVVAGDEPWVGPGGRRTVDRAGLLAEAGLTDEQLAEVEKCGLVEPTAGDRFDRDAVFAARSLAELFEAGLEARHLRPLRSTADREAGLIAQLVAAQAQQQDPDARERAGADAAAHSATLLRLHALLVKSALGRELGS